MKRPFAYLLPLTLLGACAHHDSPPAPAAILSPPSAAQLERRIDAIMRRHGVVTGAVGVLRRGNLAFERYYGEAVPGVATGPQTRFDVASITKTVAAETF